MKSPTKASMYGADRVAGKLDTFNRRCKI
eukprot:SAG31_NODE_43236_length_268_cov_0.603550_1_plen_28_part_10